MKIIHERIIQNNKLKGYLIAFKETDVSHVLVGYSMCHPYDKFNKEKGLSIAFSRAMKWNENPKVSNSIPHSVRPQFEKFIKRCHRYFKTNMDTVYSSIVWRN